MLLFEAGPYFESLEVRLFSQASPGRSVDYKIIPNPEARSLTFIEVGQEKVKSTVLNYIQQDDQYALICPLTGACMDRVYVHLRRLVSDYVVLRRTYLAGNEARRRMVVARLSGADGRGIARGGNRVALLKELKALTPKGFSGDETLLNEAERASQRAQSDRNVLRIRYSDPLDTVTGLARGQGGALGPTETLALAHFEAAIVRNRAASPQGGGAALAPLPEGCSRRVWEDHPRVDLRALASRGYCILGERRPGVLDWSGASPIIDGLRFVIDLTRPSDPHMELELMSNGEPSYQTISLIDRGIGGRVRWCFVCPVLCKPVEIVALRAGRFASRSAQRLVNRSQLRSPTEPKS